MSKSKSVKSAFTSRFEEITVYAVLGT